MPFSTNCDAAALLKARTLQSNIEYGQHVDLMAQYAAELVNAKVDVIFTGGGLSNSRRSAGDETIPILAFVDDMIGSGLVNSLARPDGNTTGVSIFARA